MWITLLLTTAILRATNSLNCETVVIDRKNGGQIGYVSSPGYPLGYKGAMRCVFNLTAGPGFTVQLTFVDFDLEERYSKSEQCLKDYVLLNVHDHEGREHVGRRYCGIDTPPPLKTMQPAVELTFVTTHPSGRRGFKLQYEFVPEAQVLEPASTYNDPDLRHQWECGGHAPSEAIDGEITSPGFPKTYPRDVVCNWLIRVPLGKRIYVRIIHLELSPTVAGCEKVSLFISDGYKHELLESASARKWMDQSSTMRFCGSQSYYNEEGMKSYLSEGNRVVVRFVTKAPPQPEQYVQFEEEGLPIGFKLFWTTVESLVDDDDPPCEGFTCRGGEFCIDNGQKICAERTKLCIDKSLRCNGISNCAENDNSDEINCYSNHIIATATSVFTALIVFTVILIMYHKLTMRREIHRRLHERAKRLRQTIEAAAKEIEFNSVEKFEPIVPRVKVTPVQSPKQRIVPVNPPRSPFFTAFSGMDPALISPLLSTTMFQENGSFRTTNKCLQSPKNGNHGQLPVNDENDNATWMLLSQSKFYDKPHLDEVLGYVQTADV